MLHRSAGSVFIEENSGFANQRIGRIVFRCVQGKAGLGIAKINGAYAGFAKRAEHVFSIFVFGPDAKLVKDRIIFINPAIAIGIIRCKVRKSIPAFCAE